MNLEREPCDLYKHVITRRQLLRRGSTGIGSLALGSLLAPEAFAAGLAGPGGRQCDICRHYVNHYGILVKPLIPGEL